jgi:hypothetical protein
LAAGDGGFAAGEADEVVVGQGGELAAVGGGEAIVALEAARRSSEDCQLCLNPNLFE